MPTDTDAVEPHDLEEPYSEDADIIKMCVFNLFSREPGDDRFRLLDAIAFHCDAEFGGVLLDLGRGQLSEEAKRGLMSSPAAPVLLAYIVQAMLTYNELNSPFWEGSGWASTATKRAALASAFRLVAKPGESYPTMNSRMAAGLHFQILFRQALALELAKPNAVQRKAAKAARVAALKGMYEWYHREKYDDTDDTHRSRMTNIRRKLSHLCTESSEGQGER